MRSVDGVAYRDVGNEREQGRGSVAYRDVGNEREHAYRDVGRTSPRMDEVERSRSQSREQCRSNCRRTR